MGTVTNFKALQLRKQLKDEGRSITWLARELGYSRGYVSNVLSGLDDWTEEFQARAIQALGESATIADVYKGRVVKLPASIFRNRDLWTPDIMAEAYKVAWQDSWVKEHGSETLAQAAGVAWRMALATAGVPA